MVEVRDTLQEMLDLLDVSHLAIVPSDVAEVLLAENNENGSDEAGSADTAEPGLESAARAESGTTGLHVRAARNRILVTRVEEGSPAARAGVRPGWILTHVNDKPLAPLLELDAEKMTPARRDFLVWRQVSSRLLGSPGSSVKIQFLDHTDQPRTLELDRELLPGEPIKFGSLPVMYADLHSERIESGEHQIGLIRFNIWMLPTALGFNRAIDEHREADGIVIDLRGNVGGVIGMIIGVTGHFFNEPKSLGTLILRDNRLNLFINPRLVNAANQRVQPFAGPVAILIDEVSTSASEVFAGGMKELGRARVFGRPTSGQALPAIFQRLPNGDLLYHPFGDFVTGTGVRFEGDGVRPDVEIPLERRPLLRGEDIPLKSAIDWIKSELD